MAQFFTALHLFFDLLSLPFIVGAGAAGLGALLFKRNRPLRAAWAAGVLCALVHGAGVLSLGWKDGDVLGYALMLLVAALTAAAFRS